MWASYHDTKKYRRFIRSEMISRYTIYENDSSLKIEYFV
jgi:hypothetical protein